MKISETLKRTKELVSKNQSPKEGLAKFTDFFFNTTIEDLKKDEDQDMLLFQSGGPYSWSPNYEVSITRQFMKNDDEGEYEGMIHLRVAYAYNPDSLSKCPENQIWNKYETTEEFMKAVTETGIFGVIDSREFLDLSIEVEDV